MSYQNNIAKESLSLKNHIVWPCFIFVTQNDPIMHNPNDKPINCFILLVFSNFSTFTQYMSASHGYITIGGTEYGGCGVDKKEGESLTSTRKINRHGDAHQLISMQVSRNCHATYALEL